MEWLTKINDAIEFIETSITGKVNYAMAASVACCSLSRFQNMFLFITDITPAEYVRRRRMALSAEELKPGGLFLFDVYTILRGKDKRDQTSWSMNPNGGFMSAKPHISFSADYYYGEAAEGCRTVIIEESSIRCYNLWDCYFTTQSLLKEAEPFGLTGHGFYNDAAGTHYSENSHTLCAILKKKREKGKVYGSHFKRLFTRALFY